MNETWVEQSVNPDVPNLYQNSFPTSFAERKSWFPVLRVPQPVKELLLAVSSLLKLSQGMDTKSAGIAPTLTSAKSLHYLTQRPRVVSTPRLEGLDKQHESRRRVSDDDPFNLEGIAANARSGITDEPVFT